MDITTWDREDIGTVRVGPRESQEQGEDQDERLANHPQDLKRSQRQRMQQDTLLL